MVCLASRRSASWLPEALNGGWIYRDRVRAAEQGLPLSRFYAERHRHSDAAIWRQRLAAGEIRLNGEVLQGDVALEAGDRLAWHRPPWREAAVPARWDVLFDDDDLLVLDKPSGLPVLPAGGWLEHTVLRLLERRHRIDPAGVPRPVHRLGRFTSGLLVCARRPATRAWLSAALRESTAAAALEGAASVTAEGMAEEELERPLAERWEGAGGLQAETTRPRLAPWTPDGAVAGLERPAGCRKVYRALLRPGALAIRAGETLTIRTPIGRRPHRLLGTIWCAADGAQALDLPACSHVTLLQRSETADLVAVAIASGRPHQIRIHCAAAGAPLLGDPLYGVGGGAADAAVPGDGGYRLQAWRLSLRTPDGEPLELEVPRPLELPPADGTSGPLEGDQA
mgnify:CR=1 FL=1